MAGDLPFAPSSPAARLRQQNHTGAHEEEETGRRQMCDEARYECQRRMTKIAGEQVRPQFRFQLAMGDEAVGMVQGHEHDNESAQRIQGQ